MGMIAIRLALPQRSPRPLSVPCTWRAPARTAASELATALPVSLWQWMPRRSPGTCRATSPTMRSISSRQGAAVGVAQHDPARARLVRGLDAVQRVVGVGLVAVEEVLGVEHHLVGLLGRQRDALADHRDVLVEARRRARRRHGSPRSCRPCRPPRAPPSRMALEARIVGGAAARAPGHAEGGELGALAAPADRRRRRRRSGWRRASRPRCSRCRAVELARDRRLVGGGEVDALRLRAVAQRGVVDIDAFLAHAVRLPISPCGAVPYTEPARTPSHIGGRSGEGRAQQQRPQVAGQ